MFSSHGPAFRREPGVPGEPARAVRQLRIEAAKAHGFGKPRAAALMAALARVLPRTGGPVFAAIEGWPGDLAADGVIFRLNAGLHALALAGREAGVLASLYRGGAMMPSMNRLVTISSPSIRVLTGASSISFCPMLPAWT